MKPDDDPPDWARLAEEAKVRVADAIARLREIVEAYDPIELISRVATFILIYKPDGHKDAGGPHKSETHLEYLVSFVAARPLSQTRLFPSPDVVQLVIELLTTIHMGADWHYKFKGRVQTSSQGSAAAEIADSLRMDRLHVRGDGYWLHLRRMILDLLSPHDAKLKESLGFTSHEYLGFMERTEQHLSEHLTQEAVTHVEPFMQIYRQWLREEGGEPKLDEEGWRQFVAANESDVSEAKARFDTFGTPTGFVFQPQSEAERRILKALSCELGANRQFLGIKPEHALWPLTPSDTDSRPILHHEGVFYGFNLAKLSREAYTLIGDRLRAAAPDYWATTFNKRRDGYLEVEVAGLFQQALPSAEVLRSVFYPFGTNQTAEADVVVLCDDVLIVVECKAGRIDPASKRGASKRIESDLKDTIVAGFNQAERFVRELVARGTLELTAGSQPKTIIDVSRFNRVFRVSVTLDLISSVSTEMWKLAEAGFAKDIERCWSVSLNDLRVIVDVLDRPAFFLHYLVRRLDLNVLRSVIARDELDYLMHYVKQGLFFREGNAPKDHERVLLVRFTDELDQYYRRLEGISNEGEKPRVAVGELTLDLLSKLEANTPKHWACGSIELLEFDTPVRDELLGKRVDHIRQLEHPQGSYVLSFVANSESCCALALATSKELERVWEVIVGRCADRCRQHGWKVVWCFLGETPGKGSAVRVFQVTPETEVSDYGARLLRQLVFHVTEHRESKSPR